MVGALDKLSLVFPVIFSASSSIGSKPRSMALASSNIG